MSARLTKSEAFLLDWLGKEDFSTYGECKGPDFEALEHRGLVRLWPNDERHKDYWRVSLTAQGIQVLCERRHG